MDNAFDQTIVLKKNFKDFFIFGMKEKKCSSLTAINEYLSGMGI